jgi:hypothetical protein
MAQILSVHILKQAEVLMAALILLTAMHSRISLPTADRDSNLISRII